MKEPVQPELTEINDRLVEGLATCRSVVANYKSLLQDRHEIASNDDQTDGGPEDVIIAKE